MLCKTFSGGRTSGGAKSTIAYLLDDRVLDGTSKILSGDPDLTLKIIEHIAEKRAWSWSSGVMTFSENLSEEKLKEIIEEHKRVFMPGLSEDQYNSLYVMHKDKGRSEIHFIIPRTELTTGKAFNPYFIKKDFLPSNKHENNNLH